MTENTKSRGNTALISRYQQNNITNSQYQNYLNGLSDSENKLPETICPLPQNSMQRILSRVSSMRSHSNRELAHLKTIQATQDVTVALKFWHRGMDDETIEMYVWIGIALALDFSRNEIIARLELPSEVSNCIPEG